METHTIIQQLNGIFADLLDRNDIVLTRETTANDVEEWDSLAHIHLVVAIERHFKIRFTSLEIQNWDNVGSLVDSIASKLNAQ
jgi:acyl carrier protein